MPIDRRFYYQRLLHGAASRCYAVPRPDDHGNYRRDDATAAATITARERAHVIRAYVRLGLRVAPLRSSEQLLSIDGIGTKIVELMDDEEARRKRAAAWGEQTKSKKPPGWGRVANVPSAVLLALLRRREGEEARRAAPPPPPVVDQWGAVVDAEGAAPSSDDEEPPRPPGVTVEDLARDASRFFDDAPVGGRCDNGAVPIPLLMDVLTPLRSGAWSSDDNRAAALVFPRKRRGRPDLYDLTAAGAKFASSIREEARRSEAERAGKGDPIVRSSGVIGGDGGGPSMMSSSSSSSSSSQVAAAESTTVHGGRYEVVLLVDSREGGGGASLGLTKLCDLLTTRGGYSVTFEARALPVGDYMFVLRRVAKDSGAPGGAAGVRGGPGTVAAGNRDAVRLITKRAETVLPLLIERKTAADFGESIRDGRLDKQLATMRRAVAILKGLPPTASAGPYARPHYTVLMEGYLEMHVCACLCRGTPYCVHRGYPRLDVAQARLDDLRGSGHLEVRDHTHAAFQFLCDHYFALKAACEEVALTSIQGGRLGPTYDQLKDRLSSTKRSGTEESSHAPGDADEAQAIAPRASLSGQASTASGGVRNPYKRDNNAASRSPHDGRAPAQTPCVAKAAAPGAASPATHATASTRGAPHNPYKKPHASSCRSNSNGAVPAAQSLATLNGAHHPPSAEGLDELYDRVLTVKTDTLKEWCEERGKSKTGAKRHLADRLVHDPPLPDLFAARKRDGFWVPEKANSSMGVVLLLLHRGLVPAEFTKKDATTAADRSGLSDQPMTGGARVAGRSWGYDGWSNFNRTLLHGERGREALATRIPGSRPDRYVLTEGGKQLAAAVHRHAHSHWEPPCDCGAAAVDMNACKAEYFRKLTRQMEGYEMGSGGRKKRSSSSRKRSASAGKKNSSDSQRQRHSDGTQQATNPKTRPAAPKKAWHDTSMSGLSSNDDDSDLNGHEESSKDTSLDSSDLCASRATDSVRHPVVSPETRSDRGIPARRGDTNQSSRVGSQDEVVVSLLESSDDEYETDDEPTGDGEISSGEQLRRNDGNVARHGRGSSLAGSNEIIVVDPPSPPSAMPNASLGSTISTTDKSKCAGRLVIEID